jgi:hypothetical protein
MFFRRPNGKSQVNEALKDIAVAKTKAAMDRVWNLIDA